MVMESIGASHNGQRHGNPAGEPEYAVQPFGRGELAYRSDLQRVVRRGARGLFVEESGVVDGEKSGAFASERYGRRLRRMDCPSTQNRIFRSSRFRPNVRRRIRANQPMLATTGGFRRAVRALRGRRSARGGAACGSAGSARAAPAVVVVEHHEFVGPGADKPPAAPQGGRRVAAYPSCGAFAPHYPDAAECDARQFSGVSVAFEQLFETPALRGWQWYSARPHSRRHFDQQRGVEHLVERIPGYGIYDADLHG